MWGLTGSGGCPAGIPSAATRPKAGMQAVMHTTTSKEQEIFINEKDGWKGSSGVTWRLPMPLASPSYMGTVSCFLRKNGSEKQRVQVKTAVP